MSGNGGLSFVFRFPLLFVSGIRCILTHNNKSSSNIFIMGAS